MKLFGNFREGFGGAGFGVGHPLWGVCDGEAIVGVFRTQLLGSIIGFIQNGLSQKIENESKNHFSFSVQTTMFSVGPL